MTILPFFGYSLYQMFFIFIFWSFIGWMIEIVDMTYETGAFQNRGFLNMPICPIYGGGVLMILVFFRPLKETYLALFLVSTVLCTAFEYFMGWFMEKVFHTRWWDYSHMKFNLHGYICLRNSLFFGSGCVVMYHFVEPFYEGLVAKIPVRAGIVFISVMSVLIVIDTAASVVAAAKLRSRIRRLEEISHIMLKVAEATGMRLADGTLAVKSGIDKAKDQAENIYGKAKDQAENIYGKARDQAENIHEKAHDVRVRVNEYNREKIEKLRAEYERLMLGGSITNRLLNAFPRMVSSDHARILTNMKNRIHVHRFGKLFRSVISRRNKNFVPENEEYTDDLIIIDFTDDEPVSVTDTEKEQVHASVCKR